MPKCQVEITNTIVEPPVGLEPTTSCLQNMHSTIKVKEAIVTPVGLGPTALTLKV